jgi:hypothetical protein
MHINTYSLITIAIFIVYISRQVLIYKKQIDIQNIKLIKFYLDQQLIIKLIKIANNNHQKSLHESIQTIQDYYNISQINIYSNDAKSLANSSKNDSWKLENYIKENNSLIEDTIKNSNVFADFINLCDKTYKIYITSIDQNNLILFLFEDYPARQEIIYVLDLVREIIALTFCKQQKT